MPNFKVGYQIHPQHCTIDQIREAYRTADSLGVDSLWVWDHMHTLYGARDGIHFASTPILAGMAAETRRATYGSLVVSNSYRNPEFYAYEVWTMNQMSGGRAVLGIGAGWKERDYDEYGYEFGDAPFRLRELGKALPRIKERFRKLEEMWGGGAGIPIMIGGAGEKVTLKLTAQYADIWNTFPPLENWSRKNEILNQWCEKVGRDPKAVERTCSINREHFGDLDRFVAAGVQHFILRGAAPFDLADLRELIRLRDS